MHPALQATPARENSGKTVLWICMAAWAVSFFLPALRTHSLFLQDRQFGFEAFLSSLIAFFVPIYGWVWPVNILMGLAPIFARSMARGKNIRGYVFSLCAWTALPLAVPIYQSLDDAHHIVQLQVGFYLWQFSLLGAVTWFLWMLYRRPIVLVATGLLSFSFLFGSAVVTPEYVARQELGKAVRDAESRIAAFERTGQAESLSVPAWELTKFVDSSQPGMRDFQVATGYMNDIYTWRQRERIPDSALIDRYPEVPVHFPEAAPTSPASIHANDSNHYAGDNLQVWMDYRDLQFAALKRAKLYLGNAEIDLGMTRGQRQMPELLGSADLVGASPLAKRDVPAHFANLGSLVQVQRAGAQSSTRAENQTPLRAQDTIATGAGSSATIMLADKTMCTIEADSQMVVKENAQNASGRTFVKVELVNGKLLLDSRTRIYGSTAQVEFATLPGTVDLEPESSLEVENDYRTSLTQVLQKRGSAQVRLTGEATITLLEHETFTFANNGLRSKTTASARLVRSRGAR